MIFNIKLLKTIYTVLSQILKITNKLVNKCIFQIQNLKTTVFGFNKIDYYLDFS